MSPALMPIALRVRKVATMGAGWYPPNHPKHVPGLAFNTHAERGVKFSQSGDAWWDGTPRDKMLGDYGPAAFASKSRQRRMASALIAKIPLVLSRHIAATYYPRQEATA